jgi:hypothetical protein
LLNAGTALDDVGPALGSGFTSWPSSAPAQVVSQAVEDAPAGPTPAGKASASTLAIGVAAAGGVVVVASVVLTARWYVVRRRRLRSSLSYPEQPVHQGKRVRVMPERSSPKPVPRNPLWACGSIQPSIRIDPTIDPWVDRIGTPGSMVGSIHMPIQITCCRPVPAKLAIAPPPHTHSPLHLVHSIHINMSPATGSCSTPTCTRSLSAVVLLTPQALHTGTLTVCSLQA